MALVLVGVVARLYRIDALPDGMYQERAYDTAAIARNFYEGSMNIFYPQIDWRGSSPGYVGAEFQIYTFLMALLYRAFGPEEWLGRALNIVVYALSAVLLFRLTRRLFDETAGLFAAFFYSAVPLSFWFTRVIQPDALMALASLVGLYFFWVWTEEGRWPALAMSALGVGLALLIKPTNLYLGLPLLYLGHRAFGWGLFRQPVLWLFALATVVPALLWYAHAFNLWSEYGNAMLGGWGPKQGMWALTDSRWRPFAELLLTRLQWEITTPPGLVLLLVGLVARFPWRTHLLYWWGAAFAVCILLVPTANFDHSYYQLPMVFVAAAFMAVGVRTLLTKQVLGHVTVAVLCLSVAGYSYWQLRNDLKPWVVETELVAFGDVVNRATKPDDLIIIARAGGFSQEERPYYNHRTPEGKLLPSHPREFYLSHRKGWSINGSEASPEFVDTLRERGARYFATPGPYVLHDVPDLKTWLERFHTPIDVTARWALYRLEGPTPEGHGSQPEEGW